MSYPEWAPPEHYWYVTTDSACGMRVDERTAQQISDEYERGDRVLVFTDLTGSACRLAAAHYIGTWSSSPESRARDTALAKMVQGEEESF